MRKILFTLLAALTIPAATHKAKVEKCIKGLNI